MEIPKRLILSMMLLITLSACANKYETLTPGIQAKMLDDLKTGSLTLDCQTNCTMTWIQQRGALQALDMAERWNDLAIKVMQIGYQQDLAYYYLGQAAQGLGYHDGAIKYYKFAGALASGQVRTSQCASMSTEMRDGCEGVDILSVVPVLIKASQDVLDEEARQKALQNAPQVAPEPTPAPPPKKLKKKVAPAESNWAVPPPPSNN